MDQEGMSKQVGALLGLAELSGDETFTAFYRRYLVLALEAYRREKISRRKLLEIAGKLGIGAEEVETVIDGLGLDHEGETEVLLPTT